jgi:predicted transcriptional regulator
VLREHEASPRELADELDAPLGVTAYHVRRLVDLGLISLVRETRRRGSIEHHYLAAEPAGEG